MDIGFGVKFRGLGLWILIILRPEFRSSTAAFHLVSTRPTARPHAGFLQAKYLYIMEGLCWRVGCAESSGGGRRVRTKWTFQGGAALGKVQLQVAD